MKKIFFNTCKTILLSIPLAVFVSHLVFRTNFYKEVAISFFPYFLSLYVLIFVFNLILNLNRLKKIFVVFLVVLNFITILYFPYRIFSFYTVLKVDTQKDFEIIKITTINMHWRNSSYDKMETFFQNQNSDILVLIEFTDLMYANLKPYLNLNYPYSNLYTFDQEKPYAGNVIFSKYELSNLENEVVSGYYSGFAKADVLIDDQTFTVFAVHTTAPMNKQWFEDRNQQLEMLSDRIMEYDANKVIVAGDFNTTPWSYYYSKFENNINSRFKNATKFQDPTFSWQHPDYPLISKMHIDHIFVSNSIDVISAKTQDFEGSDHRVITIQILNSYL